VKSITLPDALTMVANRPGLSDAQRRAMTSGLSRAQRLIGLPAGMIDLAPDFLRSALLTKSASEHGLAEGSMRNIVSSLRATLRLAGVIDFENTPATPAWSELIQKMPVRKRAALTGFARYCSAASVAPGEVDDAVLDAFATWLEQRTLVARPRKRAGEVRGTWNRAVNTIEGWPPAKLSALRTEGQYILPLESFPRSFQDDVQAFGKRLGASGLDPIFDDEADSSACAAMASQKRACRPSTIQTRLGHCRWAASALVAAGTPIQEITSLASLVKPIDRVKLILKFLYKRAGDRPSAGAGHVADVLRIIARHYLQLPVEQIERIKGWTKPVRLNYPGMTEKNSTHVRRILDPKTEARFLEMPAGLMAAARKLRLKAPAQAAGLAMRAMAIGLLTSLPLRLSNTVNLRLDRHLQRADPPRGPISIIRIAPEETKNRRVIEIPVSNRLSGLIDEWLRDYRHLIGSPASPYLFPGQVCSTRPITPQGFRDAVRNTIQRHTGVPLTPHQFRHVAAFLFLRENPGHYEEVRQLLGHADIRTTVRSYCGIESEAAVQRYHAIIETRRAGAKPNTDAARRKRQTRGGKNCGT
jgi:integrase